MVKVWHWLHSTILPDTLTGYIADSTPFPRSKQAEEIIYRFNIDASDFSTMGIVKETRELAPYDCYATINHIENQVNKKEENVTRY